MKRKKNLLAIFLILICSAANGQVITTYAGNGTYIDVPSECPPDGGQATAIPLNVPNIIKTDGAGNIYTYAYGPYWDCYHIKKISASGVITTVVGNGGLNTHSGDGGPATAAGISIYSGFCLDNAGNIYITEAGSTPSGYSVTWIRKVNTSGIISTIAESDTTGVLGDGGPATAAGFDATDIVADAAGNIYFTDYEGNRIRKINTTGIISTIAGDGTQGYSGDGGPATNAQLSFPHLMTMDASGNIFFTYVADPANLNSTVLRKVTPAGIISTIADTAKLQMSGGSGLVADNAGNVYYTDGYVVKKINSSGVITNVAGNATEIGFNGDGGSPLAATFNGPTGLSLDAAGNLYIADAGNYRIRKVSPNNTTGVNTISSPGNRGLRIWPEPNDGTFTININSATNKTASVVISNMLGQKMKEITAATNQDINVQLDAPAGMYFITAIAGQEIQSDKVMLR